VVAGWFLPLAATTTVRSAQIASVATSVAVSPDGRRLLAAFVLFGLFQLMPVAGPAGRALGSNASTPRVAWQLTLPGYAGVHLGPASPRAVALFFAEQPSYAVPGKVTVIAVESGTGAVAWRSADLSPREVPEFAADADRFYLRSMRNQQVSAWRWDAGQRLWGAHAEAGSRLLAHDTRVIWVAYSGDLVAADGATGRKLWDRGFAPRDEWTPMTIALGNVYLRAFDKTNSVLVALDLETGKVARQGVFRYGVSGQYVFDYLRWSPRSQLFYGQDGVEGAGVHGRVVRVIRPDLSLVWERPDIKSCRTAGDVLACERYDRLGNGPYVRTGLVAMELATGRTLWQRTAQEDLDDTVVGEWNGTVIVTHSGKLVALRPRDGQTVWSLTVPVTDARAYGALLVVALEQPGQSARVEAYRVP
jgi:outer membrane protein assembly factor BamB